mmetsp:Transcript_42561/g.107385  ORF Transcript_42561/g.107385 Transcript_42561/m.107385 type:complete len:285 (+) Transcript_42561:343-1197(+)
MNQLGDRWPVEMLKVTTRDYVGVGGSVGDDFDREVDIVGRRLHLLEVGQRLGLVLSGTLHAERLQRLHGDHPGADTGGPVLAQEGTERNVLPLLDVTRTPVVHHHHAKDVVLRIFHGDRMSKLVTGTHEEGHLQLKVQQTTGTEHGRRVLVGTSLATGTMYINTGHDHRGGTSMVANRQMKPVGLQSVGSTTEHGTNVGGMFATRVKVGIVTDPCRKQHGHIGLFHQCLGTKLFVQTRICTLGKQSGDLGTRRRPLRLAQRHEVVEQRLTKSGGQSRVIGKETR